MKKTLVAIAVLAVAGAASAQVTLYGLIDVGLRASDVGGTTTTTMTGQLSGNRWGMKGEEDLGGGLKAMFQLESGFSLDDGVIAQSTAGKNPALFGRLSMVGISGSFGTVTLGRQYTPTDKALSIDAAGFGGVGGGGPIYTTMCANYAQIDSKCGGRADNSINYSLPAMGGVSGNILVSLDESSTTSQMPSKNVGMNLGYSAGPLSLMAATDAVTATSAAKSDTGWLLGGKYDLGPAAVSLVFSGGTSVADVTDAGWGLGVGIPLGQVGIRIAYARETSKVSGATAEAVTTGFGGDVIYTLSKRTNVYVGYLNKEDTSAANVSTKATHLGAGVRHSF